MDLCGKDAYFFSTQPLLIAETTPYSRQLKSEIDPKIKLQYCFVVKNGPYNILDCLNRILAKHSAFHMGKFS